jgi:predicted metal-binding membrane protein
MMILAMMVPLVLGSIRFTAVRSFWNRRHRAMAGFLTGFLGLWVVAGAIALAGVFLLESAVESRSVAAAGFLLAAVWQHAPARRRALVACHATTPLTARGRRADLDCIRYGWTIGQHCLVACWALMLGFVLAGHGLALMAGVSALAIVERYARRPHLRATSLALLALAAGLIWSDRRVSPEVDDRVPELHRGGGMLGQAPAAESQLLQALSHHHARHLGIHRESHVP